MKASQGILTVRGGMTSHAAVVARGMGTCCVSGCGDIAMDEDNKKFTLGWQRHINEGDYISIDGSTGNIYDGISLQLMLQLLANLDVSWLGLINTEHLRLEQMLILQQMLRKLENLVQKVSVFAVQSICSLKKTELQLFSEMICSDTVEEREAALDKILPYQQGDFEALYEALEG